MKIIVNKFIFKLLSIISIALLAGITCLQFNANTNERTFLNLQKALLSSEAIQVLNVFKKNPKIYTQGFFFDQGIIYESGVINNNNYLLKKIYSNNQIVKTIPLLNLSGRGIAKCNKKFYQLTGKEKKILRYSFPELEILSPVSIDYEMNQGEGLANLTNETLVATDGTNNLYILDCDNDLAVIKSIPVFDMDGNAMNGLKDIVVVGEYVYANRHNDNRVLKIDPRTGAVVKAYDMINLINFELKMKTLSQNDIARGSVLNGITYDSDRKLFILTGRNWGYYYEVELK